MTTTTAHRNPQVVIVGGGPTGLAMAHLLQIWGVRTLLIEQRTTPSRHPRATLVNTRSMEIFRLLGVADRVRRAGVPLEKSARISWVSSMAGAEIGRLDVIDSAEKLMRLAAQSPAFPVICPQNRIEEILVTSLAVLKDDIALTGRRAVRIVSGETSVRLDIVGPSGRAGTIEAEYAVLAEGLNGRLREQAGIDLVTEQPLGQLLDIHFLADLEQWTRGRESALYWIVNSLVQGVLITVDPRRGEWLLEVPALTEEEERRLADGSSDPPGLVEAAIGAAGVSARIRSVRTWSMGSTSVKRWRDTHGRVFVAGDAAHTFPPTGGFGMNTGIQDAHNLGWKLAGVLQGWAPPALLDSYERERRPVSEFNGEQSERNALEMRALLEHGVGMADALAGRGASGDRARATLRARIEEQRPHFDFQGQALGFRYSSPGGPASETVPTVVEYVPSAAVGARAPHAWLDGPRGRVSTCDLTRDRFGLFTTAKAAPGLSDATNRLRAVRRAPIEVVVVGSAQAPPRHLRDTTGNCRRTYGLDDATAVLVRPDGHVATRLRVGEGITEELDQAMVEAVTAGLAGSTP